MKRKTTFLERAALAASPYERARRFLVETIWQLDPTRLGPWWKRWGVLALRIVYLAGRGLASSRTQLQSAALTYTTILALVPAFAVMFSLFQGFVGLQGPGERLKDFAVKSIAASPDQELVLREYLQKFVDNTQQSMSSGGGIAGVAFIFLVFTVITLLSSIESTMNDVWGVKRSRTFTQKFITYWALATLGPVLLSIALVAGSTFGAKVSAYAPDKLIGALKKPPATAENVAPMVPDEDFGFTGVGGALANRHIRLDAAGSDAISDPRDELRYVLTGRLPTVEEVQEQRGFRYTAFLLTAIAFSLLYQFMPNTKVRMKPALIGGFVAAAAWQSSKWVLASGTSSLVKYNTIYGGLATIPILMFWFYISWLIVILGAELTFAIQNLGSQGKEELAREASPRCREVVALRLMTLIAEAFDRGVEPPVLSALAHKLGAPLALVSEIVFHLCEDGLLREIEVGEEDRGYVPARPLGAITLADVGRSIRDRSGINFTLEGGADAAIVEAELAQADAAERGTLGQVSLEEVVRQIRGRASAAGTFDTRPTAIRPHVPRPETPARPEAPAGSDVSGASAASAEPALPETPALPGTPARPETPALPETPARPETPALPETPARATGHWKALGDMPAPAPGVS